MVRVVASPRQIDNAIVFAERALRKSGLNVRDLRPDSVNNRVTARTGLSLFSWGETIEVSVESHPNETVFAVRSLAPQPVTWGKNDRNEEAVASTITALLQ